MKIRAQKSDGTPLESSYLFDQENAVEFTRLLNQDRFITRAMGGVRVGWPELPPQAKILDLACGAGGWALDIAFEMPNAEVFGVDISQSMIEYANARAHSQRLTNASFEVMDIRRRLDFPDTSFDLVHARFLAAVLKREDWSPLIAECTRLLRPDGLLQLVEGDDAGRSLSPALEQINTIGIQALWMKGYGFSPDGRTFGMAPALPHLFKQAGYHDLHLSTTTLDHSRDSEGWADFYHNQELLIHEMKDLVIMCGLTTENEFDVLSQQALIEMYTNDFVAIGQILNVWGRK